MVNIPECPVGLDGANPPASGAKVIEYRDDPDFPDKQFRLFATQSDPSFGVKPDVSTTCALRRAMRDLSKNNGNFDMTPCGVCLRGTVTYRHPRPTLNFP